MSRSASLVVLDGKIIVETALLAAEEKCWRNMLPKRAPDKSKGREAAWIVPLKRRRAFGKHVNLVLEKHKNNVAELYGFFGLVGIGTRWADDDRVKWCLYVGDRKLKKGMKL